MDVSRTAPKLNAIHKCSIMMLWMALCLLGFRLARSNIQPLVTVQVTPRTTMPALPSTNAPYWKERPTGWQWLTGVATAVAMLTSGSEITPALDQPLQMQIEQVAPMKEGSIPNARPEVAPMKEGSTAIAQPEANQGIELPGMSVESGIWSSPNSFVTITLAVILFGLLSTWLREWYTMLTGNTVDTPSEPRDVSVGDGFPFEASEGKAQPAEQSQPNIMDATSSDTIQQLQPSVSVVEPSIPPAVPPTMITRVPQTPALPTVVAKKVPQLPAVTKTPKRDVRSKLAQEVRDALLRVIGITILALMDIQMGHFLAANHIKFPATVVTLMLTFLGLCSVGTIMPEAAETVVRFFTPAVAFLTRWLALMFVPTLCSIPTVADLVSAREVVSVAAIVITRCLTMVATSGLLGTLLLKERSQESQPVNTSKSSNAKPSATGPSLPGNTFMKGLGVGVLTGLLGMVLMPQHICVFRYLLYLSSMFLSFSLSLHLQARIGRHNPTLAKVAQPVVLTSCATLGLMKLLALWQGIPFLTALSQFNTGDRLPVPRGAGDAVSLLLSPAVVAMAFGMFQKRAVVFQYLVPLLTLTIAHSVMSLFATAGACRALGLSQVLSFSIITNSATTPLAVEATKALGIGLPPVTAAAAIMSGVIGAMGGLLILDIFNIKGVMARGIAIGCNSHGVGTATVSQDEPASGPFAAMAFAFVGAFTATLCSIPIFRTLLGTVLGA